MIRDEDFVRGSVPMTKEEVRWIALVKAEIGPSSFVLDVGAGTGSISIEAAKIAAKGKIFALEKNPEALRLIHTNMEKFAVKKECCSILMQFRLRGIFTSM